MLPKRDMETAEPSVVKKLEVLCKAQKLTLLIAGLNTEKDRLICRIKEVPSFEARVRIP